MKLLSFLFLTAFLTTSPITWLTNFDKAKTEASDNKKLILLNFSGSDWCVPCIKMKKQIFESDVFEDFAAHNLVLVNADFPRLQKNKLSKEQTKQNEILAEKYNPQGAFPFTLLLDSNGKVLKKWDGLPKEGVDDFTNEISRIAHGGK